jgi:hypothetical protein
MFIVYLKRLDKHKGFSERVFELWFNQIEYHCKSHNDNNKKREKSYNKLKPCLEIC